MSDKLTSPPTYIYAEPNDGDWREGKWEFLPCAKSIHYVRADIHSPGDFAELSAKAVEWITRLGELQAGEIKSGRVVYYVYDAGIVDDLRHEMETYIDTILEEPK